MTKTISLRFLEETFGLSGKTAIVTGASGDIGGAVSLALAQAGANVALAGRKAEKLKNLQQKIKNLGRRSISIKADVTRPSQVGLLAKCTLDELGKIDILVTCHGINKRIPTEEYSLKDWEIVVDTNLKGTFLCCQSVGRIMIKQKSGAIVNISSLSGSRGYELGYSAYSSSKAGIDALTRTLAVEWGKYNVRVNAVAPYWIRTKLTEQVLSQPSFRRKVLQGIPICRLGTPNDVVGAVLFLVSNASRWITGQVIYVDGGRTIS